MLTKKGFDEFRKEVERALGDVAKKYGADIKGGKIGYSENNFTMELKVNKIDIGGISFEQAEFEKYCGLFGLKPEDYNRRITYCGKGYNLIGFKPSASKYNVLAKCEDGVTYKWTQDMAKMFVNAQK